MAFDPTDKQYQVFEQSKPDKESTWTFPPSSDGWVHAHNALRLEISNIRSALEAIEKRNKNLNEWEVQTLKRAAAVHFEHIHNHHSNEDDILVPELRKRFNFPEKLEADHITIIEKLGVVEEIVKKLKVGDDLVKSNLRNMWVEYEKTLLPHLAEEEVVGLSLMRAYFTPKDMVPITQKLVARCSQNELGAFIHCMGEKRCRMEFMKQEQIPWFVWYLSFKGALHKYENEFVKDVTSLISGEEPRKSFSFAWLKVF